MKRFNFLVMFCLAFTLFSSVSCTEKNKQVTADMVSGSLSSAVIASLSPCSNPDLVRKDIGNAVNGWFNLPQNKGIVGEVCKMAVNATIPLIFTGTTMMVKPEWGCTGKTSSDLISKLAGMACSAIPL